MKANAKINLGLNIISKREDGYHNLETVFFPIGLADELDITLASEQDDIQFITEGIEVDCAPEDNLIIRAAKMFTDKSLTIRFKKNIPFGAGLGGGSSDAAHTALYINDLLQLGLNKEHLCKQVAKLGADCPFFILNKPCLATGIGDILTPINLSLKGYSLVLIKPNIHVSTKVAYAGVKPHTPKIPIHEIIQQPVSTWKKLLVNDFETSVFAQFPAIQNIKEQLYESGATYASMSGSGSSVFGLFTNDKCPTKEHLQDLFTSCFIYREDY